MGILLLVVIIILTFILISNRKSKNEYKRKMKEQGFDKGIHDIAYRYGLSNLTEHSLVNIYANDKELIIEYKDVNHQIDFKKLTAIEFVNKVQELQKNKSALGRGITGSLVLGLLGAVAGVASGVGKKQERGGFVVINYKSGNEIRLIILQVKNGVTSLSESTKFVKDMREKIIQLNTEDGTIRL